MFILWVRPSCPLPAMLACTDHVAVCCDRHWSTLLRWPRSPMCQRDRRRPTRSWRACVNATPTWCSKPCWWAHQSAASRCTMLHLIMPFPTALHKSLHLCYTWHALSSSSSRVTAPHHTLSAHVTAPDHTLSNSSSQAAAPCHTYHALSNSSWHVCTSSHPFCTCHCTSSHPFCTCHCTSSHPFCTCHCTSSHPFCTCHCTSSHPFCTCHCTSSHPFCTCHYTSSHPFCTCHCTSSHPFCTCHCTSSHPFCTCHCTSSHPFCTCHCTSSHPFCTCHCTSSHPFCTCHCTSSHPFQQLLTCHCTWSHSLLILWLRCMDKLWLNQHVFFSAFFGGVGWGWRGVLAPKGSQGCFIIICGYCLRGVVGCSVEGGRWELSCRVLPGVRRADPRCHPVARAVARGAGGGLTTLLWGAQCQGHVHDPWTPPCHDRERPANAEGDGFQSGIETAFSQVLR